MTEIFRDLYPSIIFHALKDNHRKFENWAKLRIVSKEFQRISNLHLLEQKDFISIHFINLLEDRENLVDFVPVCDLLNLLIGLGFNPFERFFADGELQCSVFSSIVNKEKMETRHLDRPIKIIAMKTFRTLVETRLRPWDDEDEATFDSKMYKLALIADDVEYVMNKINSENIYAAHAYLVFICSSYGSINVLREIVPELEENRISRIKWNKFIYEACKQGHADVLALLLSHPTANISVTYHSNFQNSPHFYATNSGREEILRILIADKRIKLHAGESIRQSAVRGSIECLRILLYSKRLDPIYYADYAIKELQKNGWDAEELIEDERELGRMVASGEYYD